MMGGGLAILGPDSSVVQTLRLTPRFTFDSPGRFTVSVTGNMTRMLGPTGRLEALPIELLVR